MLSEVANLINPTSGGWDVELVKDIFWQEDADLILALPVHEGRRLGIMISKVHSVLKVPIKFVGRTACVQDVRGGEQGSSVATVTTMRKKIWQLECPN